MKTLFPYIEEVDELRRRDKRMAQLIDRFGYLERPAGREFFEAFTESIVSQQISTATTKNIMERLAALLGRITPAALLAADAERIKECGIPMRKIAWLKEAAAKIEDGTLDMAAMASMSDSEFTERLASIGGVGVWTAEMLLIFALGRTDVLSEHDFIIRRTIASLYNEKRLTPKRFERYKRLFSPYGTTASLYLWAYGNAIPKGIRRITVRPLQFRRLKDKTIHYSFHNTQVGEMLVASTVKGVCRVAFADDRAEAVKALAEEFPKAVTVESPDKSHADIVKALECRGSAPLTFYLQGTPFERRVWRQLTTIPYGITVSYAEIASHLGNVKASRAVGNAVGANPIVVLIPCHRVIRSDGETGEYSGGAAKKIMLLEKERLQ